MKAGLILFTKEKLQKTKEEKKEIRRQTLGRSDDEKTEGNYGTKNLAILDVMFSLLCRGAGVLRTAFRERKGIRTGGGGRRNCEKPGASAG